MYLTKCNGRSPRGLGSSGPAMSKVQSDTDLGSQHLTHTHTHAHSSDRVVRPWKLEHNIFELPDSSHSPGLIRRLLREPDSCL